MRYAFFVARQPLRTLWVFVLFALSLGNAASAATLTIENDTLLVTFDQEQGQFSVAQKSTGREFVREGQCDATTRDAHIRAVADATFGLGKAIQAPRKGGGQVSLELYPELPFLLLRGTLNGTSTNDVKSLPMADFLINLEKPAKALRTMGTAGLTAPDQNPGSYLFLTLADPETRRGVVAGWLTAERGDGVLFSDVTNGAVRFRTQIDYGRLRLLPGAEAKLETLVIGMFDDARLGEEQFANAIARQLHVRLRPQPAGYCTWYSDTHGGASDEKSIVALAEVVAKELKPFGMSVVQIDDKWQDGKQRNGPARRFLKVKPDGPYAHGMAPVAERLHALGLTAGIWFLPFASDYLDPEFKDRQDWFVRRQDGTPFETPWGNTSLDLTRPEVQAYLAEMARTIHGWGYNYFKMDGLWTGTASEQIYVNDGYRDDHLGSNASFHDPLKSNLETLRDGLKLLRAAAGPDVFFSGCNVSQNMRTLGGCMGLVDSMRIGPDNGHRWGDYHQEIAHNGSGSIITGPVRGTRLYFLNGRVWWNDPDPTYVRASIPLEHARLITSWVALAGQFYLNSDWIPALPPQRLDIIKRTIPAHHATARPVDYLESVMPRMWLVTDEHGAIRRDVLGLYNWENTAQTIECTALHAGLASRARYYAFDFWNNTPLPPVSSDLRFELDKESCRVIALRQAEGHPVIVSTSRHVTQGILDIQEERWTGGTLSGRSQVVGNDTYELRVAGLLDGPHRWELQAAELSDSDQKAGVTIQALPKAEGEAGWRRVKITSPESREVSWTLRF